MSKIICKQIDANWHNNARSLDWWRLGKRIRSRAGREECWKTGNLAVLVLLTGEAVGGVIWHFCVKLSTCNSVTQQFLSRGTHQIKSHTNDGGQGAGGNWTAHHWASRWLRCDGWAHVAVRNKGLDVHEATCGNMTHSERARGNGMSSIYQYYLPSTIYIHRKHIHTENHYIHFVYKEKQTL